MDIAFVLDDVIERRSSALSLSNGIGANQSCPSVLVQMVVSEAKPVRTKVNRVFDIGKAIEHAVYILVTQGCPHVLSAKKWRISDNSIGFRPLAE